MKRRHITATYPILSGLSTTRSSKALLRLALAFAALACLLLPACGASEPPRPARESDDPTRVLWPRAEKAIRLRFIADRDLNIYDAKAHSLQICVYQMDNPDAFLNLARTPEGVTGLLKAEPFDSSVKAVVRLFMQPLEDRVVELDRAENATYVGIVCGYFDSEPKDSVGVWEIKPQSETTGRLFWKSTVYRAGTLDLALRLAARSMAEKERPEAKTATETGGAQ